jgi:hypothetical protein
MSLYPNDIVTSVTNAFVTVVTIMVVPISEVMNCNTSNMHVHVARHVAQHGTNTVDEHVFGKRFHFMQVCMNLHAHCRGI